MGELAAAFAGDEADLRLEGSLARLVEASASHRAREDPVAFVRFVRDLPIAARVGACEALSPEGASELGLAFDCARGDPAASRAFDERYVSRVPEALARMKLDRATVDDLAQRVREKLLLSDEGAPRFAAYAGRGELAGLVRVTATREALSLVRKKRPEVELAPDDLLQDGAAPPELQAIRDRYRPAFRAAFVAALAGLERRERNLLRLHVVEGVTLEALAELYRVHRATVVRWLAKAREALLEATGRELAGRTGASPEEVESLLGLLASRVDVTLERLLASTQA